MIIKDSLLKVLSGFLFFLSFIFLILSISAAYSAGRDTGVTDGMCRAYEGYVISYDPPTCDVNGYVVDLRNKNGR